jgi:putative MATE family efflux protein
LQAVPSYRNIWNLSYPIILSLIAQNLITVIDTAFLGRVGEVELGAAAIGGLFYFSLFMLGFGFGTGAQILMGRRNGEKNYLQVGKVFDHTIYIFIALSLTLIFLSYLVSTKFLHFFISSQAIYEASVIYLDIRIWGIIFAFSNVAFRAYFVGITKTKLLGYGAMIMAVVNIILDYLLIFGRLGFPEMGIAGAALASVISEFVALVFFIIATAYDSDSRKNAIFQFPKLDVDIIRRTWSISVFIMLQNFASVAGWFLFFLVIEQTGERPLAISNIIRSLYMILMIHIWAFSSSVNTLVSNAIGAGASQFVMAIIHKVNKISILIALFVVAVSLIIPDLLLQIYTDDPELIIGSKPTLYVVTGALLPLALAVNYFSGISGTARTKTALLIELAAILLYLIYVFVVTFVTESSLPVIWISEYVYIFTLGIFSYLYLKFGNWYNKII